MKLPIHDKKFRFLLIAVVIVVTLEILSLTGVYLPMPYAPFIYAGFILAIGYEILWDGVKAAYKLNFGSINLLMLIAVIGAFYLQQYPEAAVVIVVYMLGENLEDIGIENSMSALDDLVSKSPKTAFVKAEENYIEVEKISVGTIIQVKPGEMIPMDGNIVSGHSTVDEASITGEPIPKDKHEGDTVFAGALNKNGFLEIKTTKLAVDSTFAKIIKLTFEAAENKSEAQNFINRFAKYYTPVVIVLSALIFTIPVFLLKQDLNHWLLQAITLLVIACPCALVISTPVAIFAAIGNASGKGALVKGGRYMEALAEVKAVALDKTRTITYGNPTVSDVIPLNGTSMEELLGCASGAEVFSEHPLAQAIVDRSIKEGFEPHKVEKFKNIAGKGVTAKCLVCEDETILLGKLSFIAEHEKITDDIKEIVQRLSDEGKTAVVVSFGKGVAGVIGLTDEVKSDSVHALKELSKMHIDTVMLTGDNIKAANYVAQQVGINKVYGELLPDDKASKINDLLKEYEQVVMVGDGINDAPALAQSTVGIAMGAAGSDTAIETANIALMNDKLSLIPFLITLSKRTVSRIKVNVWGAILVKLIFVVLAIMGHSHLVLAIAADVGVTLVVILLSLELMNYKDKSLES